MRVGCTKSHVLRLTSSTQHLVVNARSMSPTHSSIHLAFIAITCISFVDVIIPQTKQPKNSKAPRSALSYTSYQPVANPASCWMHRCEQNHHCNSYKETLTISIIQCQMPCLAQVMAIGTAKTPSSIVCQSLPPSTDYFLFLTQSWVAAPE